LLPAGNPSFSALVIFFSDTSALVDLLTPDLRQAGNKIRKTAIIKATNRVKERLFLKCFIISAKLNIRELYRFAVMP
jgi:hypothetical protein